MTAATLSIVQSSLRNDQCNLHRIAKPNQTVIKLGGSIKSLDLIPKVTQLAYCP
jgi:hypothetical protein